MLSTSAFYNTSVCSVFQELLSFAFEEGCLLILAAVAYLVATGAFKVRGATTNQAKSSKIVCNQRDDIKLGPLQAVTRAVKDGSAEQAIVAVLAHKSESTSPLPVGLGVKFLLLLSRQQLPSIAPHSSELAGHILEQSLEKALAEACRRGDMAMCKMLHSMCELFQIKKTPITYELLLKTQCNDVKQLHAFIAAIDEIGFEYTKSLVEAILVACANVRDADLAASVLAKVELPRSDKDLCAALLKVYASCEQWDMAICVYEEVMIPADLKPDSVVAELLVKAASCTGRTELLAKLSDSSSDLAKQSKAIRSLGKDGNLQSALSIFNAHKSNGNSLLYNSVLEACVQCNDLQMAQQYFEEAKECGFADTVTYNTVMKGQLAVGDSRAAHRLLEEMNERGLLASLVTYHKLLNAKVQCGDVRAAWRLIEEMQAAKLVPNAVSYSILLKAFLGPSHANDLARAMKLIDVMETPMDEVLFASVAEACIRTGRLDVLSERTFQYKEKGGLQGLTAPTYGSMIKAYGQARDVEQVWVLWKEMAKRQVRPTSITLGCMIEALVMNRCSDQAWELVQKISADASQKPLLNTVIYSTILKGFAMTKQVDRLMALYEEMRASEIICNTITYNTMLNAFAQRGDMKMVPQLLEDMRNANPPVEPDIVTYSTMVKGFCAAGDVDKGMKLLHDMQNSNLAPDEVMFNSLLDGCARQHRLEDALQLLKEMKATGVAPSNYTLSIMVKLLGRARRLNQAFTMVKSMCAEHGFRANVQVYTCLIQACFHNRQLSKALALHDQMVDEDCVLDQKVYVSLARGCLQAGAVDKAAEVARCAHGIPGHSLRQPRCRPSGVDGQCLDEILTKLGRNTEASKKLAAEVADATKPGMQQPQQPWRKQPWHRKQSDSEAKTLSKVKQGSNFIRETLAVVSAC